VKIKIVQSIIFITMACTSFASNSFSQFFCPDPDSLNQSPHYFFTVEGISGIKTELGLARLRGITNPAQVNPFGRFLVAEEDQRTREITCKYAGGNLPGGIVLLLPSVYKRDTTSRAWFRSLNGLECTPSSAEKTRTCPLVLG
jgi:hypothetical protein